MKSITIGLTIFLFTNLSYGTGFLNCEMSVENAKPFQKYALKITTQNKVSLKVGELPYKGSSKKLILKTSENLMNGTVYEPDSRVPNTTYFYFGNKKNPTFGKVTQLGRSYMGFIYFSSEEQELSTYTERRIPIICTNIAH